MNLCFRSLYQRNIRGFFSRQLFRHEKRRRDLHKGETLVHPFGPVPSGTHRKKLPVRKNKPITQKTIKLPSKQKPHAFQKLAMNRSEATVILHSDSSPPEMLPGFFVFLLIFTSNYPSHLTINSKWHIVQLIYLTNDV